MLIAAYVCAILAILTFIIWILFDASFNVLLDVVLIDLRIRVHPGIDMRASHRWIELGPRLVMFGTLAAVGCIATVYVFLRLFVGTPAERTLIAWGLGVALVAGWLAFLPCYNILCSLGYRLRIYLHLAEFTKLLTALYENWPTESGSMPVLGEYRVDQEYPDCLIVSDVIAGYPLQEEVGPFVRKAPNGLIRMDVGSPDGYKLELVPNGLEPESFSDDFRDFEVHHTLGGMLQLKGPIYLTWYTQRSSMDELMEEVLESEGEN